MSLNSLQNIYWIGDVESTNSMSQEIDPVTLCHSMSLVVTLTKDCAPPQVLDPYCYFPFVFRCWSNKHIRYNCLVDPYCYFPFAFGCWSNKHWSHSDIRVINVYCNIFLMLLLFYCSYACHNPFKGWSLQHLKTNGK